MASTTDTSLREEMEKEEKEIKEERRDEETQSLNKIIEVGMKTEEMVKTKGWKYWENEIKFRIEEANSGVYDLDPVKKPTMITRKLERAATFRELLSKIHKTIEMKNTAVQRMAEIKK